MVASAGVPSLRKRMRQTGLQGDEVMRVSVVNVGRLGLSSRPLAARGRPNCHESRGTSMTEVGSEALSSGAPWPLAGDWAGTAGLEGGLGGGAGGAGDAGP